MSKFKNVSGKWFRFRDILAKQNEIFTIEEKFLAEIQGQIGAGNIILVKSKNIKLEKTKLEKTKLKKKNKKEKIK